MTSSDCLTVTGEPRRPNFVEVRREELDTDFQKFNVRGSRPEPERPNSLPSRSRQSFRPSFGEPEPVRQRLNNRFSSEIQNSIDETVRTLEAARQR